MNPTPSRSAKSFGIYLTAVLLSVTLMPPSLSGQARDNPAPSSVPSSGLGSISGRVFNRATGQYLNNARVTVLGTDAMTFTDETGAYRLFRVPAGAQTLEVSFTGMETQRVPVEVNHGVLTEADVTFAGASSAGTSVAGEEVIQLDTYKVTSQVMDGAAIAINEQRVASNIKTVVSADEYGIVPDGNIGEFLKMMPGVVMSYRGGDPREVYLNGAPSSSVPITIDGFGLASSEISGTGRNVELNNTSINTLSRIENVRSVMPDTPASALAGTINLVPRNAFERNKPEFRGTFYLNWRDETAEFHRSKGPRREPMFKALPGFELSWVVPVNKRFGFSVSTGGSLQYQENSTFNETWRGSGFVTNGNAFPDTTPDRPYLTDITIGVQSKVAERSSLGLTADYRLAPGSTLSFGFQFGTLHTDFSQRNMQVFAVNPDNTGQALFRPIEYTTTYTHGGIGRGEVRVQTAANNRYTQTYMPTLRYRFKGSDWSADAGVGLSKAQNIFRNVSRGIFQTTVNRRSNVTVNFDDIDAGYRSPGSFTIFDGTTGAAVNPFNLSSYALNNANGNEQTKNSSILTTFASVGRIFDWRWPVSFKTGVQFDRTLNDNRSASTGPLNYLGPDGIGATTPTASADNNASQFYDPNFFQRVPLGVPIIQWVDNQSAFENYTANPSYWTNNPNMIYRNQVGASKFSDEIVSAAFLRGDIELFDRRVLVNGGLRAEQTNIKAQGPLTDPTLNFQRDANGNVLRDPAGNPLLIRPASDALGVSQLTFIDRGYKVEKEYFRVFPSVNVRYTIADNLVARTAYYQSIGRPDFNQYSGGITLPNLEQAPSPTNRITINNASIKSWTADTFTVSLEYYFQRVGSFSVTAYDRKFHNFFVSSVTQPTAELLALYGLDPDTYSAFDVATQSNLSEDLGTRGLDVSYKQALTFLPHWARGIQVFANVSWLKFSEMPAVLTTSVSINDFNLFVPRTANFGISLTRQKFNVRFNVNYLSRVRQNLITGRSIEARTYNWQPARSFLELSGEYAFRRNLSVFGSMRNLDNQPEDVESYGPNTPVNTRFRGSNSFFTLVTVGIKGTF